MLIPLILLLVTIAAGFAGFSEGQGMFAGLCLVSIYVLWLLPRFVRRRVTMLGTYTHEMCHGLAAAGSGGKFTKFQVGRDGGACAVAGGNSLLVTSAGYLGATLIGALLVLASARTEMGLAAPLIAAAFFGAGALKAADWTTATLGLAAMAAMVATAIFATGTLWSRVLVNLLGVALVWGSVGALRTLIAVSMRRGRTGSDAEVMASQTGVPALAWSLLFALGGVALIAGAAVAGMHVAG